LYVLRRKRGVAMHLSAQDKADLVAFLQTL
jgi:hypothetical protein